MNRFSTRSIVLLMPLSALFLVASAGLVASIVEYRPWGVPVIRLSEYDEKLKRIAFENEVKSGDFEGPLPSLHYDDRRIDFGQVSAGVELPHTFKLRNLGNAELRFLDLSSASESVRCELSAKLILPGGDALLSVTWDTSNDVANSFHRIRLETNDPLQRSVTFTLVADIKQACAVPKQIGVGAFDFGDSITGEFVVASETSDNLVVEDVHSDLPNFEWFVEENPSSDESRTDKNAKVAHNVIVRFVPDKYGPINNELVLKMSLDGEPIERLSTITGKIRSPITFAHPELHIDTGLNIGTVNSKKPFEVAVSVRQRSPQSRELKVLDYYPKELDVSLTPSQSVAGAFRLAIKVPEGTPTMVFNLKGHRGYVSVGDPNDKEFSNWFPLLGAVVHPSK